ncbi:MAG: GNAT family N-acetyltransferase [Chloroflexi bacterium]|nr:GNAT family N-acetyltransferase [Chloroflexota bacterium]
MNAAEIEGPRLDEALDVFSAAIGFPRRHTRVVGLGDTMRRHAPRSGFKALGAFDSADTLVGFTYGYTSQPGLWWREQIVSGLSTEQRDFWLADAFELAELHVHPSAQGNHLGSQLHDGLLRDLPHATALLSVMHRSDRAKQLYASRGWQVLIQELRFSTDPATPFSVLGLEL